MSYKQIINGFVKGMEGFPGARECLIHEQGSEFKSESHFPVNVGQEVLKSRGNTYLG